MKNIDSKNNSFDLRACLETIMTYVRNHESNLAEIEFNKNIEDIFKDIKTLPDGVAIFLYELEEYLHGSHIQYFYGYSDEEYKEYILGEYEEFLKGI